MSNVKVFKKGEVLCKEGDRAQFVYLIQSGSVNVHLTRQKQNIDLFNLGGMQMVGEHLLSGAATHPHTAVAVTETKAVELPADAIKVQIEASSQLMKFMIKGLSDKLKLVMKDFQSMKLERDKTPCPPEQTAKVFGTVYHVAKAKGENAAGGKVSVSWPLMKQYAQRIFLESPKRLETAVNIFVKLGAATYEMVKNEEDPDLPEEIGFVHFTDLPLVEQFFEFYQYYHFKGGRQELLKTDERAMQIVGILMDLGANERPDRYGAVLLNYSDVVDKIKQEMGLQLNNDHFTLLETKGLFVKRQSTDLGVRLQFDFQEFERTLRVWKVLREVERWNERGYVDPKEPVVENKPGAVSQAACPSCGHGYEGAPKFCSECGHKLAAAA